MFTGIVEELGYVHTLTKNQQSARILIRCKHILEGLKVGDSVAVNGACLTVTAILFNGFAADIMYETLKRTALGGVFSGDEVNLERAMSAGGRFDGHMVSGHIDGVGTVNMVKRVGIALIYQIRTGRDFMAGIVEKGSIAIDGISLTVVETGHDYFTVSVIPHTAEITVLKNRRTGSRVNLEKDMLGKYTMDQKKTSGITRAFLAEHGF